MTQGKNQAGGRWTSSADGPAEQIEWKSKHEESYRLPAKSNAMQTELCVHSIYQSILRRHTAACKLPVRGVIGEALY